MPPRIICVLALGLSISIDITFSLSTGAVATGGGYWSLLYIREAGRPFRTRVKSEKGQLDGFQTKDNHYQWIHTGAATIGNSRQSETLSASGWDAESTGNFLDPGRYPTTNRKDESIAITNDLAPFRDQCGILSKNCGSVGQSCHSSCLLFTLRWS